MYIDVTAMFTCVRGVWINVQIVKARRWKQIRLRNINTNIIILVQGYTEQSSRMKLELLINAFW